jgi:hypothetical protein
MFDLMLISRARATKLTQLYSKKKDSPLHGTSSSESQQYCRGNVAVLPQDSLHLRECLPPGRDEINECMCTLFLSSKVVPTKENIKNLHPVMVTKTIVGTFIHFLLDYNPWSLAYGISLSSENVNDLYEENDAGDNKRCVPTALDLCNLPCKGEEKDPVLPSGGYAEHDTVFEDGEGEDIAMEAVGYTTGDYSPCNYCVMKATALAWCLDGHKLINSTVGSQLMADYDPGLMSFLFPWLDPWRIGDFCDTRR